MSDKNDTTKNERIQYTLEAARDVIKAYDEGGDLPGAIKELRACLNDTNTES